MGLCGIYKGGRQNDGISKFLKNIIVKHNIGRYCVPILCYHVSRFYSYISCLVGLYYSCFPC